MSGVSSTSSGSPVQYGTNVPPVSFPGIASGIDYNSIIQKYVNLTLQQETPLQNNVTNLNKQNAEILKIQDLVNKFQDTFGAISDPANFSATSPKSSNTAAIGASTIAGSNATPGTYVIQNATLATATQYTNDAAANGTLNTTATLANAGFSITPNNGTTGTNGKGQVTIDGVAIAYDVNSDTLTSFINNANNALSAAGVSASLSYSNGQVTVTSSQPLTLGAAGDSGNLLTALRLDTAQITNSGGTYTATSSTNVAGINLGATFNTANNAGFATAVTSGSFTINGVHFKVDATTQNLNNVLSAINNSSAGVIATFDQANDRIVLTSKTDGPQGISLGGSGDTSNFLQAAGFLSNYAQPNALSGGASQIVGQSAKVQYTDTAGATHTVFSNSNDVTNAIAGVDLKLQQPVTAAAPVTINVNQDSSGLQTAIKNFVDAYNAVIDEINTATQAPVIGSSTDSSTGQQNSSQLTTGGVLFNNQDILDLKNQLVNFVTSLGNTGSKSYNSLASIGLVLDSSFSVAAASSGDSQNTTSKDSVTTQTYQGTSGKLQALDVTKFTNALSANPSAVQALFSGANSVIGRLGSYLTTVSGLPTQLTGAIAGKIPVTSLFASITDQTNNQIQSLQQQIQLVTNQANMQADQLRREFVDSETQIAQLQSLQSSLGSLTASTKTG